MTVNLSVDFVSIARQGQWVEVRPSVVKVGGSMGFASEAWKLDTGQDYEIIARAGGMKTLIVADGDGWREAPNPRYRGRDAAEIARYTSAAA